jgi:hypothetical protein
MTGLVLPERRPLGTGLTPERVAAERILITAAIGHRRPSMQGRSWSPIPLINAIPFPATAPSGGVRRHRMPETRDA